METSAWLFAAGCFIIFGRVQSTANEDWPSESLLPVALRLTDAALEIENTNHHGSNVKTVKNSSDIVSIVIVTVIIGIVSYLICFSVLVDYCNRKDCVRARLTKEQGGAAFLRWGLGGSALPHFVSNLICFHFLRESS